MSSAGSHCGSITVGAHCRGVCAVPPSLEHGMYAPSPQAPPPNNGALPGTSLFFRLSSCLNRLADSDLEKGERRAWLSIRTLQETCISISVGLEWGRGPGLAWPGLRGGWTPAVPLPDKGPASLSFCVCVLQCLSSPGQPPCNSQCLRERMSPPCLPACLPLAGKGHRSPS